MQKLQEMKIIQKHLFKETSSTGKYLNFCSKHKGNNCVHIKMLRSILRQKLAQNILKNMIYVIPDKPILKRQKSYSRNISHIISEKKQQTVEHLNILWIDTTEQHWKKRKFLEATYICLNDIFSNFCVCITVSLCMFPQYLFIRRFLNTYFEYFHWSSVRLRSGEYDGQSNKSILFFMNHSFTIWAVFWIIILLMDPL